MGSYVADIHKRHGFAVSVYDTNEEKGRALASERGYVFSPADELAATNDVVHVAVPIPVTADVIRKYGPLVRPSAALVDLTSRKVRAVRAALESAQPGVEIFSVHYNYRPTISASGKKVIVFPIRPNDGSGAAYHEAKGILGKEGAEVIEMTSPETHDVMMDLLQGLAHTKHMVAVEAMRRLLTERGISFEELMKYSTAFFDLTSELDGRVVDGNPGLYIPLQLESDGMPAVLDAFLQAANDHATMVKTKDRKQFEMLYQAWKGFMGGYAARASAKTDKIIGIPTGVELYFEAATLPSLQGVLRRDVQTENYKYYAGDRHLLRATLPSVGELSKFVRAPELLLAQRTELKVKGCDEGQVVFYMRNKYRPQLGEGKLVMFSPYPSELERPRKEQFRVQMNNRFLDPYLNLFETWHSERVRKELGQLAGQLVAYSVTA